MRKLSEVLEIQNGFAFNSKQFGTDGEMPLIRIRDLKGGIQTETNFRGEFDERYRVRAGDFLIGMDGEFGCYEWRGPDALLNQRVCRLANFAPEIDPRYLFHGINSHLKAIEEVTGFTTVKHLSSKQIASIEFLFPPLEEQRRIVAVLDEAFAAIATATANAQKNLANARELFEAAFRERFDHVGNGWETYRMPDIAENWDYLRRPVTKSDRILGDIPYYGASGQVDSVRDHLFDDDLLLISEDGANLLMRTYPIAFSISGKSWVNNHAHILKFNHTATQRLVEYYLNSISVAPWVSGMAQPKLNQKALNNIPVPLPPHDERERLVAELDDLVAGINALEANQQERLAALAALKHSLLHRAFTAT